MKIITSIFLTALMAFVAGLYLPWWSVALAAFVVALVIRQRSFTSWLSGFSGVFILWAVLAQWIDLKNQHLLSQKIATILPLNGSSVLLVLITALLGAIVGGMGALSASYLRK